MGKHTDIDKALTQGVIDANLGLPIAAENAAFEKPTDGSPWCAVWIIPSEGGVRAITCGEDGEDEHVGIVQIDLNYPVNQGTAAARSKADAITDYFNIGRRLTFGVASVTVRSCSKSRGRLAEGYYRVSMTISWAARVPRNGS